MRKVVAGIVIGLVLGTAATAIANTTRFAYLNRGDTAISTGGETACTVRPHRGSRNGFICNVGGDYRAKYGVIVNEREVSITRYTNFNRFRVIVRKRQSPLQWRGGSRQITCRTLAPLARSCREAPDGLASSA
jgi:hypothetical protein